MSTEEQQIIIEEDVVSVASQWQLMWWRFRKHKAALIATTIVILFYLVAIFAPFLASSNPSESNVPMAYLPPQTIKFFDDGIRPKIHKVMCSRNPETYKKEYTTNPEIKLPVKFFVDGYEWKLFGFIKTTKHLYAVEDEEGNIISPYLLGSDKQGRDLLARILIGTRLSLSIGLIGVTFSLILGIVLGGASGYYGGWIDTVVQRIIEITRSIPTIPLWIALGASVPRDWSVVKIYFAITIIISLFVWTELGRVVRGRFLALREEDFVTAAKLAGASDRRVILRHMVPYFASHLIASTSLAIPFMIISETALSFLGLGLRPPAVSWGVLLQAAQNVQTVALYWWLTLPAVPVTIAVLAFNFMGDGLRDAADPYG